VFRHVTKSGLGPHVVGQRVVVRRVLPGQVGPSGGPAMTDVLGICESWADGRTTIRREDGSVVDIATADIVSGKPVPPRPSVRHRVSSREAEGHAAPHWPGVVREPLGDWELRSEPEVRDRLRKRANSCLAMGDPGVPLEEAAATVTGFYGRRDRVPMVQVEVGSDADRWFTGAGWERVPGGDSFFMLGSLSRCRRLLAGVSTDHVTVTSGDARARGSIEDLAHGDAAVDGDWLGVHGLVVAPDARRRGLARAVMAALLDWGAERGATTVWLHVETDNAPAIALYEAIGLGVHHECRYLAAPNPDRPAARQVDTGRARPDEGDPS
jgi:ribosomal protein S18 acetylase RimI-like enzyme